MMIRVLNPILMLAFFLLCFGLYSVKNDAELARQELRSINREIAEEEQSIKILKAEWSHLNRPEYLQENADRFLALTPLRAAQVAEVADVPYLGVDIFDREFGNIGFESRGARPGAARSQFVPINAEPPGEHE